METIRAQEWERLHAWVQRSWWRRFWYGTTLEQVKGNITWAPPGDFNSIIILIYPTDAEMVAMRLGVMAMRVPTVSVVSSGDLYDLTKKERL